MASTCEYRSHSGICCVGECSGPVCSLTYHRSKVGWWDLVTRYLSMLVNPLSCEASDCAWMILLLWHSMSYLLLSQFRLASKLYKFTLALEPLSVEVKITPFSCISPSFFIQVFWTLLFLVWSATRRCHHHRFSLNQKDWRFITRRSTFNVRK